MGENGQQIFAHTFFSQYIETPTHRITTGQSIQASLCGHTLLHMYTTTPQQT